MSESDNKSIGNSDENEPDFQMAQSPILKKNEFNFEASQFKPISTTVNGLPTLASPREPFKDILNGNSPPPPPHMIFPGPFFPGHLGSMLPPFMTSPMTGKMQPLPSFVPPILSADEKSSPLSSTKHSLDPNNNRIQTPPLLKRTLFSPNPMQTNHPTLGGVGPIPGPHGNNGNPPTLPPGMHPPGMQCGPGGLTQAPLMHLNLSSGFPFPPPPFFHPLFPFPLGRDLKQIKKWGRTKRKKGKVVIDKETGRKLITAITCVACFKAKKKCIYANGSSKRCNYCANRRIECVKRLDRRCQKIWHESGRQARFKTSGEQNSKKKRIEYAPVTKEEEEQERKENLTDISMIDPEISQIPELPSPEHPSINGKSNIKIEAPSEMKYYRNLLNPEPGHLLGSDLLTQ